MIEKKRENKIDKLKEKQHEENGKEKKRKDEIKK